MRLAIKGVVLVSIVLAAAVVTRFFVVPADVAPADSPEPTGTADAPPAVSADLTADEKALEFLSSVVGLNVTEYSWDESKLPPGYDAESWTEHLASLAQSNATYTYPPELCGIVKKETSCFMFKADGNTITTNGIFYNGQIAFFTISNTGGAYVYAEPPAPDLLSQARIILQRYQTYATQMYGTNNSYLEPMQDILSNIEHLSPMNVTVGNMNFHVSEREGRTRIQWIYTENDVIINYKRLSLEFYNGAFESIIDNWRLYSVGGLSVINAEEAYELALETAQNCEFRIVNEEMNEVVTLPDLSNAFYEVLFDMVPYRHGTLMDNWLNHTLSPPTRDPLTLYPYWSFCFYFPGGPIECFSGVRVSLWGDTKEIISCEGQLAHPSPIG